MAFQFALALALSFAKNRNKLKQNRSANHVFVGCHYMSLLRQRRRQLRERKSIKENFDFDPLIESLSLSSRVGSLSRMNARNKTNKQVNKRAVHGCTIKPFDFTFVFHSDELVVWTANNL